MTLDQAISTLSQSDPIVKLLQQVKLGRMKPSDAGLRAITEAGLGTYHKVLDTVQLGRAALVRPDPPPRLGVLTYARGRAPAPPRRGGLRHHLCERCRRRSP